jgi:membrane associated rhomboid family serine protease
MEREEGQRIEGEDEWRELTPDAVHVAGITISTARLWALVLEARFIQCRIVHEGGGWRLRVPPDQYDQACEELALFEDENRDWPPVAPVGRLPEGNILATLSVLILLATFHNVVRLDDVTLFGSRPEWIEIGSAKAHLIKYGEWWRLITALTLHADSVHLLSNLTIGGFFVVTLCRELGSGLGWSLILGAGILGNLTNAYLQLPTHDSVGASTAVFGAVGILAAINLVRHRQNRRRRWQLIVAAALALLALLGTEGKNTDLGAHLFGFLFGVLLGLITELLIAVKGRPRSTMNLLLALMSGMTVIAAWMAALAGSG